jgi:hypothetical protein
MSAVILTVARAVRALALGSTVAALVIAVVLYSDGVTGADVFAVLLAVAPPVMLWFLWMALRELAGLPERLRRLPETARGHGEDVRRLAEEVRPPGKRFYRVPLVLWRLREVTELVRPHAAVLPFLSPTFLSLSAIAAAAAVAETGIALVLLIAAAL